MREHCALGPAGRARRVENDRGIFLMAAFRRRSSSCLHQGSPRFVSIKARSRSVPDDHAPANAGDMVRRRKPRREVGFVDKQRGAAIVECERDLGVLVAGAERNRYRAEPQDGEERDHEFRPVADQKGYAIACGYSALGKRGGARRHLAFNFPPAPALFATDEGLAVRLRGGSCVEHVRHSRRPVGKARDDTVAVVGLPSAFGRCGERPFHDRDSGPAVRNLRSAGMPRLAGSRPRWKSTRCRSVRPYAADCGSLAHRDRWAVCSGNLLVRCADADRWPT
jgi:hypothetical protein